MKVVRLQVKIYPKGWNRLRFPGNIDIFLVLLYGDITLFSAQGVLCVCVHTFMCIERGRDGWMKSENQGYCDTFSILLISGS